MAQSPSLFGGSARQVSQPPHDRVSRRSEGWARGRRSRSSSGGSGCSRRSRTTGSSRRHRRNYRRNSRSRERSCRSRSSSSSRWRSPSSSGGSSGSSVGLERRSRRREGRRHHSRSSRGGSRPCAVSAPVVSPVPATSSGGSSSSTVAPAQTGVSVTVSGSGLGGAPLPPVGLGLADRCLMPLIESSVEAATWAGHDSPRATVYFLGDSYFHLAAQHADCRPGGRSLGCDVDAHWRGILGMRWPRVLTEVVDIARTAHSGVILVVHVGGNDLCYSRVPDLITLMKADVDRISGFFTKLVLVWSEIVPRVSWQGARNAAAIERSRRLVNSRMARFVRSKGGIVVRHRELEGDNRQFMIPDGIHLNDTGFEIFLSGLKDGLEQALLLLGGSRSTV
ncbi:uncharacterized protein LOC130367675 [Hyla sarda]|uniref:uncharacterized protein LOC130367675 n=1 Tax=Hyla sarda TaxID=327740 RepID=UPI0024C34BBB|nr:uncharacterized protein LOC130367675 [Hyla sarda]